MKMTKKEYGEYVRRKSPRSPLGLDMLRAFISGGAICCVGQFITGTYMKYGFAQENAAAVTSITLVFIGALLTGLKVYDKLAKFAGAGTLVPITGFANSVVSPALEFKSEGLITGLAAKMFIIAGPVIVYGTVASTVYGLVLALFGLA